MGKITFSNGFRAMKEVCSGSFTEKFLKTCRKYGQYRLPTPKVEVCNNYVEAMKKLNKYLKVLDKNREHLKRIEKATSLAESGGEVAPLEKDLIAGLIGKTLDWGFLRNSVRDKFRENILWPIIAIDEKLTDAYDCVWPKSKISEVKRNLKYAAYPATIVRAIMQVLY